MNAFERNFSIVELFSIIRSENGGIRENAKKVTTELLKTKYNDNPEISGMDENKTITWTIRVYLAENLEKKLCFTYAGSSEEIKINKEVADRHLVNYEWEFQKWIQSKIS